jgi:FAD/FMN-containing dehydrogenase
MAAMNDLLERLNANLGANGLLCGADVSARYACDWTGEHPQAPIAVARPQSTAEVASILRDCHAAGQPVVVQGGLTGLAGGATPRPGELSLSLERLTGIEDLDPAAGTLQLRAGTPLHVVQARATEADLAFPLDLAARGSCTIGGNIATNAGGNHVIRYGMTRSLVLGLEVVLADGTVLSSMNAMLKNNAGFDLKQLFIGTEGTLGVVTRAVLRLFPRAPEHSTVLVAVDRFADLAALLTSARRRLGPALRAFEAMWSDYFELALATWSIPRPFARPHSHYALIEIESMAGAEDAARLEATVADALERGEAADAVLARSLEDAARLWRIRDSAGELVHRLAPGYAYDVSMPLNKMETYVATVTEECLRSGLVRAFGTFGHMGDGNLHLFTALRAAEDIPQVDTIVYEALRGFGSISAEHGIGTHKRPWLGVSRSEAEIGMMRTLKTALDPRGILNPGRVV